MEELEILRAQEGFPRGYASVTAAQPRGAGAELVTIEADITRGLHAFSIVGLPTKAVEEARDRIAAAIRHAGFKSPKATNRRIILSFSPADLRKEGSHFDVALALCYLAGTGEIPLTRTAGLFIGELSLDGRIQPVKGVLPQVIAAMQAGITTVFVPLANGDEAALVPGMIVYAAHSLTEIIKHLKGDAFIPIHSGASRVPRAREGTDIADIKGQETAKRALEIAAAGQHNIVLYGPPGTGKTMLARALTGILPRLSLDEMLEVTAIHSSSGELSEGEIISFPPFRAPHHTISYPAMVGGGSSPRPGEITLAHRGVLFLDEFPEFESRTLESLRQPLEDRHITVSRSHSSFVFPANCMVVAAMNPAETLSASEEVLKKAARKQAAKISRPIVERLDLWVEVPRVSVEDISSTEVLETSEEVRERVSAARLKAAERFGQGRTNASTSSRELLEMSQVRVAATRVLHAACARLQLSPRAYHRTLRIARTIADLENSEHIDEAHVLEALQYRPKGLLGFT